MILSKICLDPHHPSIRQAMRDSGDMHRNIMRAFPSYPSYARQENHVLYRLVDEGKPHVLLQSDAAPNWLAIADLGMSDGGSRCIDPLLASFQTDNAYAFDLLCAPTFKCKGGSRNSQRRFLPTAEARFEWLERKATQGGFAVVQAVEMRQFTHTVRNPSGQHANMTFSAVRFEGALRVQEADRFRLSFSEGIGSERAFGMGMLLLRRV